MTDWDTLARAAGCSRRTLERYRKAGAPMPVAGEAAEAWVARLRAWDASRPHRRGGERVFAQQAKARAPGTDWEEQSRRALALNRLHDLAVKRGEYMPRTRVVEEWARRCFAMRTRFLSVPRAIAGAVNVAPEVRAQIEAEGMRLIREALLEFVRAGELTPTPPELEEIPQQ